MKHIIALSVALVVASQAMAGVITAQVGSQLGVMEIDSQNNGSVVDLGNGVQNWTGAMTNANMGWQVEWNFTVSSNPFITGVANFTNIAAGDMSFTFDISTASTETIIAPTVRGSSSITVLDVNGDGALMSAPVGDSIYDAFIDSTTEELIYADPFSLSAGSFLSSSFTTNWGPEPAVSASIVVGDNFGIEHDFILTAGDQATLNSSFFITPEPTSIALLLMAAGMIRRR